MTEEIRLWIEHLVTGWGSSATGAVYITDALLVVLTVIFSWLSFVVCHQMLVPITVKIAEKTDANWDDVLLN